MSKSVLLATTAANSSMRGGKSIVRTGSNTLYAFVVCSFGPGSSTLMYRKSIDNGLSWGDPVQVGVSSSPALLFAAWWDKDTPGNTGTLIHLSYIATLDDAITYRNIDTSSDTLSSAVIVFDGASIAVSGGVGTLSMTRAVGGNLYIAFDMDGGTETGFYRSVDVGANWTIRTDVFEASFDEIRLVPANLADTQDIWAVYYDDSATELSLKTYDDSANSWAETSISTGMTLSGITVTARFDYYLRLSDGYLFLASWNDFDVATADLKVWRINGAGSITALTDVVTNSDDCSGVALSYDQTSGVLWCLYVGKSDGSQTIGASVGVYGKKSTDGGSTWAAETAFVSTLALHNWLATSWGGLQSNGLPDLAVNRLTNAVFFVAQDPQADPGYLLVTN